MSRPLVIDSRDPRAASEPFVCPSCTAPLSWIRPGDLHAVSIRCRCGPGRHMNVIYEVRCRACAEILQLRDSATSGYVIVGRGTVSNPRDRIAAEIDDIERRFDRDDR